MRPAREMIRFVLGPGGEIVPDLAGRLPGRGLWVAAEREAVERAVRGGFAKAARATVKAPPDLADRLAAQLARRLVDVLGLARRAGVAVAGFDQVAAALAAGSVAVLLQASDGSMLGRGKLAAKARAQGGVAEVDCLTAAEIGLALGRDNVVHAAVAPGGLARRMLDEARRLEGFRPRGGATGDGGLGEA